MVKNCLEVFTTPGGGEVSIRPRRGKRRARTLRPCARRRRGVSWRLRGKRRVSSRRQFCRVVCCRHDDCRMGGSIRHLGRGPRCDGGVAAEAVVGRYAAELGDER